MDDLVVQNQETKKKHASFLKIYIQADKFKLNLFPIPLVLANWSISFIIRLYRFSLRFQNEKQVSKEDINEILQVSKKLLKEIRHQPPFTIIELESKDAKIIIKTK